MIAMALSLDPAVLIADEPTTALDVTVQAQILDLLARLQDELGTAIVMITHDLGVVADIADEVLVMYAGKPVEVGDRFTVFKQPHMPYTWGLLQSIPSVGSEHTGDRLTLIKGLPPSLIHLPSGCSFNPRCPYVFNHCLVEEPELLDWPRNGHLSACHLTLEDKQRIWRRRWHQPDERLPAASPHPRPPCWSGSRASRSTSRSPRASSSSEVGRVHAVDGVDLDIYEGETLGVVGETGCGKSTLARVITRLFPVTEGTVEFDGQDVTKLAGKGLRALRREIQMIFQDPTVAQPAQAGRDDHRGPVRHPRHRRGRRPQATRPGAHGGGRAQSRALQPVPERVLRRSAPADRRGAGARVAPLG